MGVSMFALLLVFLASGAIILYCLQKMNFNFAKILFLAVFGLISVCLPLTLGGELAIRVITSSFLCDRQVASQIFIRNMKHSVDMGVSILNIATGVIAAVLVIVLIAFIIISAYAVCRIVRFVKKLRSRSLGLAARHPGTIAVRVVRAPIASSPVFIRYCRFIC